MAQPHCPQAFKPRWPPYVFPDITICTCILISGSSERRWQTGFRNLQMSTLLLRHSSASASVLLLLSFAYPPVVLRSTLSPPSLPPAWLLAVTNPFSNSVTSPVSKNLVAAQQASVMA